MVDTGLKKFLVQSNQKLDDFFSYENVMFDDCVKPVDFCTSLEELVDFILLERRMFDDDLECKVGVDSGGGFFKICLNIVSHEDFNDTPAP